MKTHPWKIGVAYFIRTITHHFTGRLVAVYPQELVIEEAAWIPNDGRFSEFLATGKAEEVEPYPKGAQIIIGRASLIDALPFAHKLPSEVK